ncbi:helicase HerA-like domain-containing protein [Streptomyces sp. AS02]|uniref:helicase HerA-like domain-containing protein n=1 Tax=Streptomyces sp. AS02 TaxID=2938946 RepID=UPI0034D6A798
MVAHRPGAVAGGRTGPEVAPDRPQLFPTFLMWLLADLFHDLPEARRRRPAQVGLLLRRGTSAVRRRVRGVPGLDHPDRASHSLERGRRLLS